MTSKHHHDHEAAAAEPIDETQQQPSTTKNPDDVAVTPAGQPVAEQGTDDSAAETADKDDDSDIPF